MALRHSQICSITPLQLTNILSDQLRKVRLIDCRSFLEYNDNHIVGAVNICCSKLIKRRLQQEKISLKDLLLHCRIQIEETSDVIVYDQRSATADDVGFDSFIYILLRKLVLVFEKVYLLSGGFVHFHSVHPELCENKIWKFPGLTALSQPCLPTTSAGPTRILPFLYLGSEDDANNRELLQSHNITYELNVSNKCPKPDFISDGHFMRVPVNDSHNEKLLSFFSQTFQFIEKVRGSNECVLVHCLAGISRSPTVAIAYVMRHLQMTCEDAYRYVKAKRATISPNFNFLGQLLEYEKQLISEKVVEKQNTVQQTMSTSSQSSEFLFGPQPLLSPLPSCSAVKSGGKRFNLSLRLFPFPASPLLGSPKDASPTSAMARLQFDKPLGKENRTGGGSSGSPSMSAAPSTPGTDLEFILTRPTRLVKEQNVTSIQEEELGSWESMTKSVTKKSVSISISTGFKSRKSSLDQYQQDFEESVGSSDNAFQENDNSYSTNKKFRVHNIVVERDKGDLESQFPELPVSPLALSVKSPSGLEDSGSSVLSDGIVSSPLDGFRRDFARSDSVSTSGIGSEISDHELHTSGSWDMTESGSVQDDGVFSDTYSLYSKSPKSSRQLQLWSSDSGHWTDEGGMSSCSSSTVEVPATAGGTEGKSPEKRKHSDKLCPNSRLSLVNLEKRRSYAEATSGDWSRCESSRPKRWSLAESQSDSPTPYEGSSSGRSGKLVNKADAKSGDVDFETGSEASSSGSSSHINFGHQWFNLLSGREMTCSDREVGLYRVHSCPGIVGYRDWIEIQNQVPESPPEPISDSVLLKMRSCRNRRHEKSFDRPSSNSCSKNRFSCGNIDYDELLVKLQGVQQEPKADSTHSSSSTLASSSFSIAVQ